LSMTVWGSWEEAEPLLRGGRSDMGAFQSGTGSASVPGWDEGVSKVSRMHHDKRTDPSEDAS
jgi:hypothetical protein